MKVIKRFTLRFSSTYFSICSNYILKENVFTKLSKKRKQDKSLRFYELFIVIRITLVKINQISK